jgi:lipopolysaccharide transport protein LptA
LLRAIAVSAVLAVSSSLLFAQAAIAPAGQDSQTESNVAAQAGNDILFFADGAGSIEPSGNTRITTLRDNVRFNQGLVEIFGDTARLEQDIQTGELIKVTVEGHPARFSRSGQDSVDTITGHSASIVYYNESVNGALVSVVEFFGNASFNRGRTAFQCSQIKHIIESGATESPGPCSGLLAPTTQPEQAVSRPDTRLAPDDNEN